MKFSLAKQAVASWKRCSVARRAKTLRACVTALAMTAIVVAPRPGIAADRAGVTIVEQADSWVLDNGIVKATILKNTGRMPSLIYRGQEVLAGGGGTWEHTPEGAPHLTNRLTITPDSNGGERGEISVKAVTDGKYVLSPMAPGGGAQVDLEIRYSLGRGESGIHVYAIYDHPASYPAGSTGAEDRFIARLSHDFDWMTVDRERNMLEAAPSDWTTGVTVHAKEQRILSEGLYKNSVEHKYSYAGTLFRMPAYGWSSTARHLGLWFINPTSEYLSGGPFRIDLDAHLDAGDHPYPILLDYWHSGHYVGAATSISAGESWHKVIGPIFVYVNSLDDPIATTSAELRTLHATAGNPTLPASWTTNADALWQDALSQAKRQRGQWPFAWVKDEGYTPVEQRGTVIGQLVLDDPLAPEGRSTKLPNLVVGLSESNDKTILPDARYSGAEPPAAVDAWLHDAKGYQFFNESAEDGHFTVTKVRPGRYTLHAYADGVLGEYRKADVTVQPGRTLDLGILAWRPVRDGRQLWEIGYPDRTAGEFFKGDPDDVWLWGWNLRYALLFPDDITYTIGVSDWHKDWFFMQVPHATDLSFVNPSAIDPANQRFGWVKAESLSRYPHTNSIGPWRVYGQGRETVWTIRFPLDRPLYGRAALRVALAGQDGMNGVLPVAVNGRRVGGIGDGSDGDNARMISTNAIRYNTDKGFWQQRTLRFDASLLRAGWNEMKLTVPAGSLENGVVWDYLRLEIDEEVDRTESAQSEPGH